MTRNHRHDHADQNGAPNGGPRETTARPLAIALAIGATFLVIEVIGGWLTNSLALLADAGHMATDVAALTLSLLAVWLAKRPASARRSYGYRRAEVLAALVNASALIVVSGIIFWEAYGRLSDPPEVSSRPMLVVAVAGLVANVAAAWVLTRGGGHTHNLNTRAALLHVIGDLLGSVAAIAAALIMLATDWYLADPLLSAGIGALIVWGAVRLLIETVDVLLEATPKAIDAEAVRDAMRTMPDVTNVHDLHVWTVTSGLVSLSAHVEVADMRCWDDLLPALARLLRSRFGIAHVTLQPEAHDSSDAHFRGCSIDSPNGRVACLTAPLVER